MSANEFEMNASLRRLRSSDPVQSVGVLGENEATTASNGAFRVQTPA